MVAAQSSPAAHAAMLPNPDMAQFIKAPSGPIAPINGQFLGGR